MLEQLLQNSSNQKRLIALVGAGGKTTTMLQLAKVFKAELLSVAVTTTTRIFVPDESFYDRLCLKPEACSHKPEDQKKESITVIGAGIESNQKLIGVQPAWLDQCYENGLYDVLLVEADGAKHKPLKAPAFHEPVIPRKTTHVIGVIGLDAVGMPVCQANIHRVEVFKKLVGAEDQQEITVEMIARLILHPQGVFKNAPPASKRIMLLNKAVNSKRIADGEAIKALVNQVSTLDVLLRG